jgi:uncharacterized membrane protein (DUF2068 family)
MAPLPHTETANEPKARLKPLGLQIIAVTKLVSATLLIAAGFGIFRLMGGDLGDELEHFVHRLHLDPENKSVIKLLASVSGISKRELRAIDAGTFIYALLYIVEGVGLLLAKHWAEYLTIIATASLIPFEIFEVVRKPTFLRIAVMLINMAIVFYLIYRLRADRKASHPH